MLELIEAHLPLMLGAETGAARFATGVYGAWRLHVRALLVAAGAPDPDALIDQVLAPLDPEVVRHQRRDRGLSLDAITGALRWQAHRLLASDLGP